MAKGKTYAEIVQNRYWITPAGEAALAAAEKKEEEDNGSEPS